MTTPPQTPEDGSIDVQIHDEQLPEDVRPNPALEDTGEDGDSGIKPPGQAQRPEGAELADTDSTHGGQVGDANDAEPAADPDTQHPSGPGES